MPATSAPKIEGASAAAPTPALEDVPQAPTKARRPYVLGASVSMGFFQPSSPLMALEQMGYQRDEVIKTTTFLAPYERKFPWLKRSLRKHPASIVIALDLLHHDFRKEVVLEPEKLAYLNDLLKTLCTQSEWVLLGTTWSRYTDNAVQDLVNARLQRAQERYPNLLLFPVPEIYTAFYSTDPEEAFHYSVDGTTFAISAYNSTHLLGDDVHPNDLGARVFANLILQAFHEAWGEQRFPYFELLPGERALLAASVTGEANVLPPPIETARKRLTHGPRRRDIPAPKAPEATEPAPAADAARD